MQPWDKIEYILKEIEAKINEIRNDLEELKPKVWDSEEDAQRMYNIKEQRYYDMRARLDADYANMMKEDETI